MLGVLLTWQQEVDLMQGLGVGRRERDGEVRGTIGRSDRQYVGH